MRPITELIIHCTATRAEWWKTRTANQKVREVRKWHVEDRGWSDIGYHFLIDRDGTIYQLLPDTTFARHVIGLNHSAIGIENIGDGNKYPLTDAQLKANIELINSLGNN